MKMANVENGALQAAINNAAIGETVVLTEDITANSRITVSNVVTIDLNGYTISGSIDDGYGVVYVGTKGDLTIKDSSAKKTGRITNTIGYAIGNYGTISIYDGIFTGKYALYNFYYSKSVYGVATLYGGTFKSIDGIEFAVANCGNLTIHNGFVESIHSTSVLSVDGGTIQSLYVGTSDYNPPVETTSINGGHISSFSVEGGTSNVVSISGGTFNTSIDAKYLATGVKLTYNSKTGNYTVSESNKLKAIATSSSRLKDLVIKNGQLIFMQDVGRIAFDFNNKRVFYNQIVELTEAERVSMESPMPGYYFTTDKVVLWRYSNGWKAITEEPQEIVFIGVELPEFGKEKTLYVDKTEGNEHISVWNEADSSYQIVSDRTYSISKDDVIAMFK